MFKFHPLSVSYIKVLEEMSLRGVSKKYINIEQEDFMIDVFSLFDIQIKFSKRGLTAQGLTEEKRRDMMYYITMLKKFENTKEFTFSEAEDEKMKIAMFKTLEYFKINYSFNDVKVKEISKTRH